MTTSKQQAATQRWKSGAASRLADAPGLARGRAPSAATSASSVSQ